MVNDTTKGGSRHEVFRVKSYLRQVSDYKDSYESKRIWMAITLEWSETIKINHGVKGNLLCANGLAGK